MHQQLHLLLLFQFILLLLIHDSILQRLVVLDGVSAHLDYVIVYPLPYASESALHELIISVPCPGCSLSSFS